MPTPNYSVVFSAQLLASTTMQVGKVMITSSDDGTRYVVSTSANRGTRRSEGIALTAYTTEASVGSVQMQQSGTIDASVSGLSSGYGSLSLVRCSATGTIERIATNSVDPDTDDIIGYAEADGRVHLYFGFPFAEMLSIAGNATLAADDAIRLTNSGGTATFRGPRKMCMLEQFDSTAGTGTAATDEAALTAAITAINAGTYNGIIFGAATYTFSTGTYTLPSGVYMGMGAGKTVLSISHDAVFLQVSSNNTTIRDLTIQADHGTSSQVAIQCGASGGAACPDSNVLIEGVTILDAFGGIRCVNGSGSNHRGVRISNCEIRVSSSTLTAFGISTKEQAEFVQVTNTVIRGSSLATYYGIGMDVSAGNLHATGCTLSELNIGVQLNTGTNAGHGAFVGGCINHCGTPFKGSGDFNGFRFVGVDMYAGQFYFHDAKEIWLEHCSISPDSGGSQQIYIDGSNGTGNRIWDCQIVGDPTIDIASSGQIWFRNCVQRDNAGSVPTTISPYIQVPFTFASDANDTLTLQETTAETLIVADGTISTSRQITINQAPADAKSRQMGVVNNNTYDVTVKWSTGTAVTVPAGKTAVVGSDGTNAILLVQPDSTGSGFTAGGDLSGTSTNQTVESIDGVTMNMGAPTTGNLLRYTGTEVAFGRVDLTSSDAVTGQLDYPNGGTGLSTLGTALQVLRTNAGATAIEWGTAAASDGGANVIQTADGSGGFDGYSNVKAGSDYVSVGSTVPTTGSIRIANATKLVSINSGGSADLDMMWVDSSANLNFWGTSGSYGNFTVNIASGSEIRLSTRLTLTASLMKVALPRVGDSSPYASEGFVAITGGGKTLDSTEYTRAAIGFSASANGTYTFPAPANDDATYFKKIAAEPWDGFSGSGATLTLSDGTNTLVITRDSAWREYMFNPNGIEIIT